MSCRSNAARIKAPPDEAAVRNAVDNPGARTFLSVATHQVRKSFESGGNPSTSHIAADRNVRAPFLRKCGKPCTTQIAHVTPVCAPPKNKKNYLVRAVFYTQATAYGVLAGSYLGFLTSLTPLSSRTPGEGCLSTRNARVTLFSSPGFASMNKNLFPAENR